MGMNSWEVSMCNAQDADKYRKQRDELLYALKELLYHTKAKGDANKLLAMGRAQSLVVKIEGKREG